MPEHPIEVEADANDRLPSWGVGTWIAIAVAAATVFGGAVTTGGKLYLVADHVDQLEKWRDTHETNQKSAHAEFEVRLAKVEADGQTTAAQLDHRMTVVEAQGTEIIRRLGNIEDKLDRRGR